MFTPLWRSLPPTSWVLTGGKWTFGPPASSQTFGSFSVVATFEPLRIAAACVRELLVEQAGRRLGMPVQVLEARLGTVRIRENPATRLTFGEIVQGVSEWPEPPADPPLKSPSDFVYIGRSMPRIDFLDKLTGKPVYAYDVSKPGMLYGAVARPPTVEARMIGARTDVEVSHLRVHNTYLGGSFGRKTGLDSGVEAARLANATGRPVHVGWTREEDMRHGHVRPAQRNRLSASIESGRIMALAHNIASGEVLFPSFPKVLHHIAGEDPGVWVSGINPYHAVPSYETRVNSVKLPVRTGAWRGLGTLANTFAAESFMDEMAHFAGADPLQFRLDHLDDSLYNTRIRKTLPAAAELGRYHTPPAGHACGIAVTDYHDCLAALVVEVSVGDTGEIRVHRAAAAADLGLVINPYGAAAQAQGSIVMGLSST